MAKRTLRSTSSGKAYSPLITAEYRDEKPGAGESLERNLHRLEKWALEGLAIHRIDPGPDAGRAGLLFEELDVLSPPWFYAGALWYIRRIRRLVAKGAPAEAASFAFMLASLEGHYLLRHYEEKILKGETFVEKASANGTKGSQIRWGQGPRAEVNAIIDKLRRRKEREDLTAEELWPEFFGDLDVAGLDPEELDHRDLRKRKYKYDGGEMSFGTFQNRLK
ncbi:hypothetical protein [Thioalkalivibrio sp.]|uniref:hypothetical protein n=1 Tax=Thioalkalivibrio sp. TaxID=2093813 RepID=UPI003563A9FC